jgi:hypothetical protein
MHTRSSGFFCHGRGKVRVDWGHQDGYGELGKAERIPGISTKTATTVGWDSEMCLVAAMPR